MIIPNWLWQRAKLSPDRPALSGTEGKWTFKEMFDEAHTIARQLHSTGIRHGDRIALLGRSTEQTVLFIHACWLLGTEIVCLNTRLTAEELIWQIKDAEARKVIKDDGIPIQLTDIECLDYTVVRNMEESDFPIMEYWEEDETLSIMYTSGTTGNPKGVRQTAGNHTSSALASALNLGLTDKDSWLCMMPLFHISGLSILVRSVIYGMETVLYEKFDAEKAALQISGGHVTSMSVVALTLDRIITVMETEKLQAPPEFRTMLVGGGPVPLHFLQRAKSCGLPILQTYGMTETCSQTATLSKEDAERKAGSAGKPLFFNQLMIKGAAAPGEIGEVLVKGPHVTPGYIGSHRGKSPLTADGWLLTGDAGYLDEDGYLFIVDRRADLIISGGENIYPAEIENILVAHPSVKEAGVCAKDDKKWGQVPVAFIVLNEAVTADELQEYCAQHLARYKIPQEIHFTEHLPRNASNKLMRFELKKMI